MNGILYYICIPLGWLMKLCWQLIGDYGLAIILFTLVMKVVLLPVSVWTHHNSINMVKIQPDINFLKVKYFGDGDTIADEQAKLFKKAKYRPMLSLVPLILQMVLLMGVVYIINRPLDYLFGVSKEMSLALADLIGANTESSSYQLEIVRAIQSGTISAESVIAGYDRAAIASVVDAVKGFDLVFLGFDLATVPTAVWGVYTIIPILAGFSSWVLCFTQNLSNVLQHEQSKANKYGIMAFSVGLSLYLGCFVPSGIALYWMAGNILSVVQMYTLNAIISPKKYVDYDALERSRAELKKLRDLEPVVKKDAVWRENRRRERQDYKKFSKIVNKHFVIYSEKSGFYKYFKGVIEQLTARSNITIHYVTNDPNDVIFEVAKTNTQIKPYYIGLKKTIPLMMRLETDMMLMTTPDLDKYYLKRSIMKKDIEYVYINHGLSSSHMGLKEGALDAFDTVICSGPHISREVRAMQEHYDLPPKNIVEAGFPFGDELIKLGDEERANHKIGARREILIAPTWNEDNILDSCIGNLLDSLLCDEYHITVRPHPEYVKRYGSRMQAIVDQYADKVGDGLTFDLDFSTSRSIYSSDLIITDWSGVGLEFSVATKRPALYVNTKMKVLNENWEKLGCIPVELSMRDVMGMSISKEQTADAKTYANELLTNSEKYEKIIEDAIPSILYNVGSSAKVAATYILKSLTEKKANKDKNN